MPAGIDELALSYVARFGKDGYMDLLRAGIGAEHFDQEFRNVWGFVARSNQMHDQVPSIQQIKTRFPQFRPVKPKRSDLSQILDDLQSRYKYVRFLTACADLTGDLGSGWDGIDGTLEKMISSCTSLLNGSGSSERMVDLFSDQTSAKVMDLLSGRSQKPGIPTGIAKLDEVTGGLHPGNMIVVIGRTGQAKSWISLYVLAKAVMAGYRCVFFPLEMTLWETSARLYTLFSTLLNPGKTIRNQEILRGDVSQKKLHSFMRFLKERFGDLLYISDTGEHHDPYTIERISAEVEGMRPDMFWVDYLTLLKPSQDGWEGVRELSRGIKHAAMKTSCVGGCSAQVNRAAVKEGLLLPRLENIAYGDSIGHEADLVVSLAKSSKKDLLWWSLVKNRHGPEIPRQKMTFLPDEGILSEAGDSS